MKMKMSSATTMMPTMIRAGRIDRLVSVVERSTTTVFRDVRSSFVGCSVMGRHYIQLRRSEYLKGRCARWGSLDPDQSFGVRREEFARPDLLDAQASARAAGHTPRRTPHD